MFAVRAAPGGWTLNLVGRGRDLTNAQGMGVGLTPLAELQSHHPDALVEAVSAELMKRTFTVCCAHCIRPLRDTPPGEPACVHCHQPIGRDAPLEISEEARLSGPKKACLACAADNHVLATHCGVCGAAVGPTGPRAPTG